MHYSKLVLNAINIANKQYKDTKINQIPIIFSAFYRSSKLESEFEVCVAILSVGLEAKKLDLKELRKVFPFEVTDALFILTKDDTLSYPDYIRRIKTNPIATKVKIVELLDKLEHLALQTNKSLVKQQKEKYDFALKILK